MDDIEIEHTNPVSKVRLSIHEATQEQYDLLASVIPETESSGSAWVDVRIGPVELTVFNPKNRLH